MVRWPSLVDHLSYVILKVGDVVAIVMPNSPEYVIAFMGAAEAGFVITTLNPIYASGNFPFLNKYFT